MKYIYRGFMISIGLMVAHVVAGCNGNRHALEHNGTCDKPDSSSIFTLNHIGRQRAAFLMSLTLSLRYSQRVLTLFPLSMP